MTAGSDFTPEVIGISGVDSVDITSDIAWTLTDPSVVTWDGGTFRILQPGSTWATAHFDTIQSNPLLFVSQLPTPFTLRTIPSDTVVLVDTDFYVQIVAESGNISANVTQLASLQTTGDGTLKGSPLVGFRKDSSGLGGITFHLQDESAQLIYNAAIPGDFDLNGTLTTADAVRLIHIALDIPPAPDPYEELGADTNKDDVVDVMDLVNLVERILGTPGALTKIQPVVAANWEQVGTTLRVAGPPVRCLVIEFSEAGYIFPEPEQIFSGQDRLWLVQTEDGSRMATPFDLSVRGTISQVFAIRYQNDSAVQTPVGYRPLTAFPNPFNSQTILSFAISHQTSVALDIYSVIGQRVRRLVGGVHNAGLYSLAWDGRDLTTNHLGSGVYFGRLTTEDRTETIRMLLLQ